MLLLALLKLKFIYYSTAPRRYCIEALFQLCAPYYNSFILRQFSSQTKKALQATASVAVE